MPAGPHPVDFVHPALDLVNSDHGRGLGYADVLEQPEWLERFLRTWGFGTVGAPTRAERRRLLELRALLQRIVEALDSRRSPSAADLAALDAFLRGPRLRRRLVHGEGRYRVELLAEGRDWRSVLGEIAASFAALLAGDPGRLKLCDNPDCRFAYYDETKNRSRRWCDQAVCGNRDKVRRFRERQRDRGRGAARTEATGASEFGRG